MKRYFNFIMLAIIIGSSLTTSCKTEPTEPIDKPVQKVPNETKPYGIVINNVSMSSDIFIEVHSFIDNQIFFKDRGAKIPRISIYDPAIQELYQINTPADIGEYKYEGGEYELQAVNNKYYLSYSARNIHHPYEHELHIYDVASKQWRSLLFPVDSNDSFGILSSAVVGTKIYFICYHYYNGNFNTLKIFDTIAETFETLPFPEAKLRFATVVSGNSIYFAGGADSEKQEIYFSTVNIFNTQTKAWSKTTLSEAKADIVGLAVNNKVFFAGGFKGENMTDKVEVYDPSSGTWSFLSLSEKKRGVGIAFNDNKLFIGGGHTKTDHNGHYSYMIDIFNLSNNEHKTMELTESRGYIVAGSIGKKVYFAGGDSDAGFDAATRTTLDILTLP